jgi:GTP diphosphokinase / guanosine-3',5'-bis(diphosphate) 3'-diphosphatase
MDSLPLVVRALSFAAKKHRDQRRKDVFSTPYINHPIALVDVLLETGQVRDSVPLCAAALHDTIEDTDTTLEELQLHFGAAIASVVAEVTDDKTLPKITRKHLQIEHAARASQPAKLVKLADKICNLEDLLVSPPKDWPLRRRQDYFEWAFQVVANVRGVNVAMEARFDSVYARKP